MIRPRAALVRIVQDFFHSHLVGLVRWEEVEIEPPVRNELDGVPRSKWPDSKYEEALRMRFGIYDLMVVSPDNHPPLGLVKFTGRQDPIEGPLQPPVWSEIAKQINTDRGPHG